MESPGKIELPRAFEHADIDHLVVLIADMLDRLIEHNDKIPLSPEALTRFHSRSPPTISVLDYLRRIVKYANVERTCLLITLHYIDQICARLPHFTLSSLTCHRFIIAAVVVASKALCDAFCTNAHYAKVGGIRVGELNVLEKELLSAIDWRLTSTREVLDAYYVNLIRTHSSGAYTLAAESTSPVLSSYADSDMDSLLSASPSPSATLAMLEDDKAVQVVSVNVNGTLHGSGTNGTATARSSMEPQAIEPSAVLINRATLSPKPSTGPTLEQNMAFEALRRVSDSASTSRSAPGSSAAIAAPDSLVPLPPHERNLSSPYAPALYANTYPNNVHLSIAPNGSPTAATTKSPSPSASWRNSPSKVIKSPNKRTVDYANDTFPSSSESLSNLLPESGSGSESLLGININMDVVDIDSARPRTRPRIEHDGQGVG